MVSNRGPAAWLWVSGVAALGGWRRHLTGTLAQTRSISCHKPALGYRCTNESSLKTLQNVAMGTTIRAWRRCPNHGPHWHTLVAFRARKPRPIAHSTVGGEPARNCLRQVVLSRSRLRPTSSQSLGARHLDRLSHWVKARPRRFSARPPLREKLSHVPTLDMIRSQT